MKKNTIRCIHIYFLFVILISCEDSDKLSYEAPNYNFHLKIAFEHRDSQKNNIFTILNDSIIYSIKKNTSDSLNPFEYRHGETVLNELVFSDDFFKSGRFIFNFRFKDIHNIQSYSLVNARDSLITLKEEEHTIWKINLKRIPTFHSLIIDSVEVIGPDFQFLNIQYISNVTDTISIDSLTFLNNIILNKPFRGEYDIFVESFFMNDSNSYSKDTLIPYALFGITSDTLSTNISELLRQ